MKASLISFVIGWLVFLAAKAVVYATGTVFDLEGWIPQFVSKCSMIIFALILIRVFLKGRRFSDFGFTKHLNMGFFRSVHWGFLAGAVTSALMLLSGIHGMRSLFKDYSLLQYLLVLGLLSSVAEEILARGLVQTIAKSERPLQLGPLPLQVWVSAIFFGSMHLALIFSPMDALSIGAIVLATTLLGFICAVLREKSASIWPPLLAHIFFNVGGLVGGTIAVIVYRISTGHLPAT